MIGETYLERGRPVRLLVMAAGVQARRPWRLVNPHHSPKDCRAPMNAAIQREDGSIVCRPFRGLRRPPNGSSEP